MAWVVVVSGAIQLTNTALQVASKETTDCGKQCRAKCKDSTGFLFSGREKCKKACKSQCLNKLSPEEQAILLRKQEIEDKRIQTTSTIIVVSVILVIILVLYLIFRKK